MEKKRKQQGFSLLETLIVSTFIVAVLIVLYTQYIVIQKNYDKTYLYNSVPTIYNTRQITNYLKAKEATFVIQTLATTSNGYVDITDCANITNSTYCKDLFKTLEVKTVIIAENDLQKLIAELNVNNPYTENLYDFVKLIDTKNNSKYRVVVEYQNGNFGSLNIEI